MTDQVFESVWDAIEDTTADAENMRVRATLMHFVDQFIRTKKWTQKEAAQFFGVSQPRISDLMRGKINLFSVESLIGMVGASGRHVEVRVVDERRDDIREMEMS